MAEVLDPEHPPENTRSPNAQLAIAVTVWPLEFPSTTGEPVTQEQLLIPDGPVSPEMWT